MAERSAARRTEKSVDFKLTNDTSTMVDLGKEAAIPADNSASVAVKEGTVMTSDISEPDDS